MTAIPDEEGLRVPWTAGDVAKSILFVGAVSALILGGIRLLQLVSPGTWGAPLAIAGAFLAELTMVLAVWLFGVRKYHLSWRALGFRRFDPVRSGVLLASILLLSLSVNVLYVQVVNYLDVDVLKPAPILPHFLTGVWRFIIALILASVVAPLVEETFFRGYLFAALRGRFGSWVGAAGSAGLFTVAHLQAGVLFPIFVLGLLLAWLYHRTGSIWTCITLHCVYNSMALIAAYFLGVSGSVT